MVFNESKDILIYDYGILKCGKNEFSEIDAKDIIAYKELDYELQVLIKDKEAIKKKYSDLYIDNITIDEIMYLYIKGERC